MSEVGAAPLGPCASDVNEVISIVPDGDGCPMAHCRLTDDSAHQLASLRSMGSVQEIVDPRVASRAGMNLGAYSGQSYAVCTYEAPAYPGLACFDLHDGAVRWLSPYGDLRTDTRYRGISGILMATVTTRRSGPLRRIFAGNRREMLAYDERGGEVWRRRLADLLPHAETQVRGPRDIRFCADLSLVASTVDGWVLKLDASSGDLFDACRLRGAVRVDGKRLEGTFCSFKSSVVVGDVLYLAAEFRADKTEAIEERRRPVFLLRIDLADTSRGQSGRAIQPLAMPAADGLGPDRLLIGFWRSGGSPSALASPSAPTLIFANAYVNVGGQFKPVVVAAEDSAGELRYRWWTRLHVHPREEVLAAPALHAPSRTLLVSTHRGLHVFRNIDEMSGEVEAPEPLSPWELFDPSLHASLRDVLLTSPMALTYDEGERELVGYTNFRVTPGSGSRAFGFLGAFTIPTEPERRPHALWCHPLALSADGQPQPGPGTYGQPALFRSQDGASGLIVNTCRTGTYIFR